MFPTEFIHSPSLIPLLVVRKAVRFYFEGLLTPRPMHQAEEPPLVRCPQLRIQYIPIYPPYLKQFPVRNLRTRYTVVIGLTCFIHGGTKAKGVRELCVEEGAQEE